MLKEFFENEKIEYFGCVPFCECRVINPSLLERKCDFDPKVAVMLLAPFYTGEEEGRNISRYAAPKDYHLYFGELFGRLCGWLAEAFPGYRFQGFVDHSPIAEVHGAALAGLGVIGRKGQLINEKYGSYVFIGEILTDFPFETRTFPRRECDGCGKCEDLCPAPGSCFSMMNQAKGELSDECKRIMLETGCVWGCDVCREVCPMNEGARLTPIEAFFETARPFVTAADGIEGRAFAWRGKKVIERNLEALEAIRNA